MLPAFLYLAFVATWSALSLLTMACWLYWSLRSNPFGPGPAQRQMPLRQSCPAAQSRGSEQLLPTLRGLTQRP